MKPGHPPGLQRPWWRDRWFLAAALAGPLTWALMMAMGVERPSGHPPLTLVLTSVLAAPLVEEWVFRGLLQGALLENPRLARSRAGISGANVLTSLLFTTAHLWSRSPAAAAAVLLPSLALGASRDRYGSILPGTLLHMLWNAGFVWLFAAA